VLTRNLLIFQALCSVAVLGLRYYVCLVHFYGDRIE
jgi:hypothetical protein